MSADKIIDDILKREGGFVNHRSDKGGPTNFGITSKTLGEYRKLGRDASFVEVQNLSKEEAKEIYSSLYIRKPRFDQIRNEKLQELVVDSGVNSGTQRATEWLQEALGVVVDGNIGPKTFYALNACLPEDVYRKFLKLRFRFIGRLITETPSQAVFASGWINRISEFI